MKFVTTLAAVACAAVPAGAYAQQAPAFGGLYAGAIVGYDHVVLGDGTDTGSKDGVVYGATVGYDLAFGGSGVVGIEGEITGSSVKDTVADPASSDSATLKAGRDLYIGVRSGFQVSDRGLLYVKGGYTNARVSGSATLSGTTYTAADNLDGYRLGVGGEYSFGRFAGRLEYRYSDYGNIKVMNVDTGVDAKRHQVVVTLLGRF